MSELLGLDPDFMQSAGLAKLALRMLVDLFFAGLIVYFVYARRYGHNQFVFTYILFNLITFTLCFLLRKVPIELGFALGLFAVFGILRYRTEPIRTRDLTYLFIVIGIAIVNAVANKHVSFGELLLVNVAITGVTALCEYTPAAAKFLATSVQPRSVELIYDNMDMLRGGDQDALIRDLRERSGLDIRGVRVRQVDLLRDTARLAVYIPRETPTEIYSDEI
ncbi:MAG: DUF4956 domain-containing protein [Myxococcota bacterium]